MGMKAIIVNLKLLVLICLFVQISLKIGATYGAVIIDGPWDSIPPGAASDLTIDSDWKAITLKTDMTNQKFLLKPDPDKQGFPNTIWDLAGINGRLYCGYGDLLNNRGPVDIVSYDPLSGNLLREMLDIPEEQVGGWSAVASGYSFVGGQDAQESWTFGNFYLNDGFGWQKRRTIYKGLHVMKIVDFKSRLYANYSSDDTSPVPYTFALVSDNQGASWSYEPIDLNPVQYSSVGDIATVIHSTGEFLYAIVYFQPYGSQDYITHLYRFDSNTWEQVSISDTLGTFTPQSLFAFQEKMFVAGYVYNPETGYWRSSVYILDGSAQTEVAFLRERSIDFALWDIRNGWIYSVLTEPNSWEDPIPEYIMYRTHDGQTWETVGLLTLLPGARPMSIGFSHSRLYVGASNAGWWDEVPYTYELWPKNVYTIENAILQWNAIVPEESQLTFQVRTAAFYPDLFNKPWVGPDGSENTVFDYSGQALHPQHNGDIYLQVIIYKTPNDNGEIPLVDWVTLDTGNGSFVLAVDKGAGLYTAANSTNSSEFRSQIFKLQEPINSGKIFFEEATPNQTSLFFQVRSSLTEEQLLSQGFVGPDGTEASFYTESGESLWGGHDGNTFIQYRAVLTSLDLTQSPFLRKVILVTKSNELDHFSIQINGSTIWGAGESKTITVIAQLQNSLPIPIHGKVSLSARDVGQSTSVPIEPTEFDLSNGTGTVNVTLQRVTPTQICVSLADITSCSSVITVQPGPARSISLATDLQEPHPNWSPVSQIWQPFTLSLTIMDRYHNIVTGYSGTVQCERWSWKSEAQLFPSYRFQLSDQGIYELVDGVSISDTGEWNLVCFDRIDSSIAGTQTIDVKQVQGDINRDGVVDISDVILVLRIALGLDPPKPCSDINNDKEIDISDVILTLRMALGLDPPKPCLE